MRDNFFRDYHNGILNVISNNNNNNIFKDEYDWLIKVISLPCDRWYL